MRMNIGKSAGQNKDSILVMDSGVGGLSILRHLLPHYPHHALHYFADSAHAPYGDKTDQWVYARVLDIVENHHPQNLAALVLASSTLTAAAANNLRARYPTLPIVGVEPGLKPALVATRNYRIGVLATRLTVNSDKFLNLLSQLKTSEPHAQWVIQACPGLVEEIEKVDWDYPKIRALIEHYCQPLREQSIDTVVLGCTHYPFVADMIGEALTPSVRIIDIGQAVAAQVQRVVPHHYFDSNHATAPVMVSTSGNVHAFANLFERLLNTPPSVTQWIDR